MYTVPPVNEYEWNEYDNYYGLNGINDINMSMNLNTNIEMNNNEQMNHQ